MELLMIPFYDHVQVPRAKRRRYFRAKNKIP